MKNVSLKIQLILLACAAIGICPKNAYGFACQSASVVSEQPQSAAQQELRQIDSPKALTKELPKSADPAKKSSSPKKTKSRTLLQRLLKESIQGAQHIPATTAEIKGFQNLVTQTLSHPSDWKRLQPMWNQSGWELHFDAENPMLVIAELPDQRRGRGIYAIRMMAKSKIALQAPHRFFDQRTGVIVADLFRQQSVLAAAWNTVHRKQFDLAHEDLHFMNAFTTAMVAHEPELRTVQLHGFNNQKKTGAAKTAQAIVSDSTKYPGRLARVVSLDLKTAFGREHTRLYPIEVRELGGTQNAQAGLLRSLGTSQFLHLELNAEFRKQLDNSASKRQKFFDALNAKTKAK